MNGRPAHEIRTAWEDVSERLTVWGRLVAARYRTTEPASPTTRPDDDRKLEDAARDLGDQLNRAFTAFGDTLRDEEAKEQLRGAMKAFGDAVSLTVNETADEIRRRVGSSPSGSSSHEAPGAGPPNGSTTSSASNGSGVGADDVPPPPSD